jgi:hypothetical protein
MIDDYIQSTLRRPLPAPSDDKGFVYIFRDSSRPGLVKIGMTKGTITDRRRGLETTCKRHLDVVYLDDEDGKEQLPVANYQRAEKLVHEELDHRVRTFVCPKCQRKHREWFEVEEELAKLTVRRWTGFMRMRPYDEQGMLGMMWKDRLDTMARPKSGEGLEDYKVREKRWDEVVSAGNVDFFRYSLRRELFQKRVRRDESLAYRLVRMRWQLSCLVLSFVGFVMMIFGKWAPNVFRFGPEFFYYWWASVFWFCLACVLYHLLTE